MMHTSAKPVRQQEIQISCFSDPGVSPASVPGFTVLFMFRVFRVSSASCSCVLHTTSDLHVTRQVLLMLSAAADSTLLPHGDERVKERRRRALKGKDGNLFDADGSETLWRPSEPR